MDTSLSIYYKYTIVGCYNLKLILQLNMFNKYTQLPDIPLICFFYYYLFLNI